MYIVTCHAGLSGRITECAAVAISSGDKFQAVVCPPSNIKWSADALDKTGITEGFVAEHGRPFQEVYPRFLEFLQQQVNAAGPGAYLLLMGHNIKGKAGLSWEMVDDC